MSDGVRLTAEQTEALEWLLDLLDLEWASLGTPQKGSQRDLLREAVTRRTERYNVITGALKSARVGEGKTDYERALICGRVAEAVEAALDHADWWADPDNGIPTGPVRRRPSWRERWAAGVAAVAKNEIQR